MKKTKTDVARGSMRYIIEEYDDIYEFMDVITTRPNNTHCKRMGYSLAERGSKDFTGTASWAESIELMEKGHEEGVRMIENAAIVETDKERRPQNVVAYSGHKVYMPNFLAGHPKAMMRRVINERPGRSINLYYDVVASVCRATWEIARSARLVLDTIADIERRGINVNLYCMSMVGDKNHKERAICIIKLKDAMSRLNLKKVSYPLVHPSFLRRQMFKFLETQQDISYYGIVKSGYTYGYPLELERKYLIEADALTNDDYYIKCEYLLDHSICSTDGVKEILDKQTELKLQTA